MTFCAPSAVTHSSMQEDINVCFGTFINLCVVVFRAVPFNRFEDYEIEYIGISMVVVILEDVIVA